MNGLLPRLSRVVVGLVAALTIGACGSDRPSSSPLDASASPASQPPATSATASQPAGTNSANPAPSSAAALIPQPAVGDLQVAPDGDRVDLVMPTFTNPTHVTNPLFPVSSQASVLMLGEVDGQPFRTEVTLLPFTRIVVWEGQPVETLVSQYMAYLDGRLLEIAYDLYAQADDGSVWYFGEDVADLEDGSIVTKEGTWLAGKDAPAAMIMAADPKVGEVFRTENSPGFAFEEVTVKSVGQTLDGPLGPVAGGLIMSELHMDGTREDKTFAPGYGEYLTTDGVDVEALALAVPTNAAQGSMPIELEGLLSGAMGVFDSARSGGWETAATHVDGVTAAWSSLGTGNVPRLIEPRMTASIAALGRMVGDRDILRARQAALEVARSALDLQLRYRDPAEVDLARLDLWSAQLLIDAARKDAAAVNGDVFTLMYVRDRILRAVPESALVGINATVLDLQVASLDHDLVAATQSARRLREVLAGI